MVRLHCGRVDRSTVSASKPLDRARPERRQHRRGRIACEAHVHGRSNGRRAPQHLALARPAPPRTVRSSLCHSVYARSVLGDSAALAKPLPSMSPERADGRRRDCAERVVIAASRPSWSSGAVWPLWMAACVESQEPLGAAGAATKPGLPKKRSQSELNCVGAAHLAHGAREHRAAQHVPPRWTCPHTLRQSLRQSERHRHSRTPRA